MSRAHCAENTRCRGGWGDVGTEPERDLDLDPCRLVASDAPNAPVGNDAGGNERREDHGPLRHREHLPADGRRPDASDNRFLHRKGLGEIAGDLVGGKRHPCSRTTRRKQTGCSGGDTIGWHDVDRS